MIAEQYDIWFIIVALGLGTFLIRFSFLGLVGDRKLPDWILRHLRYTAVAVLPALIAPLILWPQATGGTPDIPRIAAAFTTLGVGYLTKSVLGAIIAGFIVLYGALALL
jgi:branched-subunit amino acid transport protein